MLFDTHLHLIDRQQLSYPWLQTESRLNQDASYADYLRIARQLGIIRSLHMEVDVDEADMENESDWVRTQINTSDSQLVGAIAACRPENNDFPAFLERQQSRPWILGFRRVLHVVDDGVSASDLFQQHLRLLGKTGHTFDICARPDQLALMTALLDACPDVQFVLDHCGVPNIKAQQLEPWQSQITELAKRPNVVGKISGVIAYGDGINWQLSDIRPFVEHMVEAFGWDRVVWGSDSPVCTLGGSVSSWVAATHALFCNVSTSERNKLYNDNAQRIWRVPSTQ